MLMVVNSGSIGRPGSVTPRIPVAGDVERALASVGDASIVVLVEGESDRVAVEIVAARLGVDLAARSIVVVAMGGITNVGRFIAEFGPSGAGRRLAGLCDDGERHVLTRACRRNGLGQVTETTLAAAGFFVCVRDLEDELIRAVGADRVVSVIEGIGELASFRIFQNQPAQRTVPQHDQLHRFFGTRSTRKTRMAHRLADEVPLDHAPPPLLQLIEHIDT
jgi:hypothetical protein